MQETTIERWMGRGTDPNGLAAAPHSNNAGKPRVFIAYAATEPEALEKLAPYGCASVERVTDEEAWQAAVLVEDSKPARESRS
jgi:hypothetical protein